MLYLYFTITSSTTNDMSNYLEANISPVSFYMGNYDNVRLNKFVCKQLHFIYYIYIYIKCIVTNKYASRVLEYNNTNSPKICT